MLERLESMASRLIEGWSARLFRARLQPVQIAKRVIRAMEAHQTISLAKTFVPNSYVVSLSPTDHAQFAQYKRSLERDLAEAVLGAARDRSFTLLAYPTVEIEEDPDVSPGDLRVACALVDASGEEVPENSAERLGSVETGHTMVLDREALRSAKPRAPQGAIVAREGSVRREVPLTAEPIGIGRDPKNDIVLDDRRVSRRHAEVRLRLGRYTLYDLQSTNGTFVNGRRIAEMVLSDDDRITIGGAELVVRLEG
ncbi:MAG: FhaA domain-containing protein [Candidatus Limnocylindria bacterium]